MTTSARDVAAALRERAPDLPAKKLHKLLYYCQGHHLAQFGRPLFSETISAWDMGPVVGQLWHAEKETGPEGDATVLSEAELNTVGYVLSRYGALTGLDLEHLTHNEEPWQSADEGRADGDSVRIEPAVIREHFVRTAVDPDDDRLPEGPELRRWLEGAARRRRTWRPDHPDELRARLSGSE